MTISEQIIQVIDALCEKFGIAINWTGENVLPVVETLCRKLVTYEIATSIAWIVFSVLIAVGSVIAMKKVNPWFINKIDHQRYDDIWEFPLTLCWLTVVGICIAAFVITCAQTADIIKCVTFPELYVFDYVKALISKGV